MTYKEVYQNPAFLTKGLPNMAALEACVADTPMSGLMLRTVLLEAARRKGEEHTRLLSDFVERKCLQMTTFFRVDDSTYFAGNDTELLRNFLKDNEKSDLCRLCFTSVTLKKDSLYRSLSDGYRILDQEEAVFRNTPLPVPEEFRETEAFFPIESWWEAKLSVNILLPFQAEVQIKLFPTEFPKNTRIESPLPHLVAIKETGKPLRVVKSKGGESHFGIHGEPFTLILPLLQTGRTATPILTAANPSVRMSVRATSASAWYYPDAPGKQIGTARVFPVSPKEGGAWECVVLEGDAVSVSASPNGATVLRMEGGVYVIPKGDLE